jgi:hypothetical protein
MEGQKPERGRSQGRGARHERSAAQRASLLDGSPSGGYDEQNHLHRGALSYCVCRKSVHYYDQAKQLKPMREEGLLGLANFSCCQISEELCQVENLIFSTGPTSLLHVFCTHISHDASAAFVAATSGELCLARAAR